MPVQNPVGPCPLSSGCPDIITVHLFLHRRLYISRQRCNLRDGNGQCREDHVPQKAGHVLCVADIGSRRKQMQNQSEYPHQKNAQKKARNRKADDIKEAENRLRQCSLLSRREYAERNGDRKRQQNHHQPQQKRHRDMPFNQAFHRHGIPNGGSEIAADKSADPVPVLLPQRKVGSQLLPQCIQLLRRCGGSENQLGRIAGDNVKGTEGQEGDQKHGNQKNNDFFYQITQGGFLFS